MFLYVCMYPSPTAWLMRERPFFASVPGRWLIRWDAKPPQIYIFWRASEDDRGCKLHNFGYQRSRTQYGWLRFDSRMRSKGSRFTLGVWGLSCLRQTLRNRSQPFAKVRNRSREGRMAVPMVSFAKGVTFGGFQRRVASFRVAGVALRDIPTCFMTCQ